MIGGAISFLSGVGILIARMRGKMLHLKRYVGPFFVVFGIAWLSMTPTTLSYWEHIETLENKYASKNYNITEGVVRVLRTQPESGHAPGDLIEVGGKKFEINYFKMSPGYKLTLSHNGYLAEGIKARIYHVDNIILRIDIFTNEKS